MFHRLVLAALAGILTPGAAQALDAGSCKSIADNAARLACYDGAPGGHAPTGVATQTLTVPDAMADFKALRGKRVEISGFAMTMGERALLYAERGTTTAIFVSIERLSLEERRELFKNCGGGCDATFTGKMTTVFMNPGLAADGVSFK